MRDNEPLGIYDELRARSETYGDYAQVRRRLACPVLAINGARPQAVNPFMRLMRYRFKKAMPVSRRYGNRPVWPEAKYGISIELVAKTVVDESGIRAEEMFGPFQTNRIVRPRQVAMWMIDRYCPQYSLPRIGLIFGRDHSTVLHAIDAVNIRLLDKEPTTVDLVARVHQRLRELAS